MHVMITPINPFLPWSEAIMVTGSQHGALCACLLRVVVLVVSRNRPATMLRVAGKRRRTCPLLQSWSMMMVLALLAVGRGSGQKRGCVGVL